MDDTKRLAILQEYLSSASLKTPFEREKGLPHGVVSRRLRNFAVEDKPQATKTAMTMDTDNDTQTVLDADGETARLRREPRAKELGLRRATTARDAYEKMTGMAEERHAIPIRKDSGAKWLHSRHGGPTPTRWPPCVDCLA